MVNMKRLPVQDDARQILNEIIGATKLAGVVRWLARGHSQGMSSR
jgi:hypothetical protein